MEEEPKPKQLCKTCGKTGWNPQQTRRQLFKNAAIAGVGIATAGSLLVGSATPAIADPEDLEIDKAICEDQFNADMNNCNLQFPDRDYESLAKRMACQSLAYGAQGVCLAEALAKEAQRRLNDARFYLTAHLPQIIYGTVIVVGVVVIVILAWPAIIAAAELAVEFAAEALAFALARAATAATIALLTAALKEAQKALNDALQGAANQNTPTGIVLG